MDETSYTEGHRRAWLQVLQTCLHHLGIDIPETQATAWLMERQELVVRLRSVCAEHGDLDWDDHEHLADVVEKHLLRYWPEG
jgi:hypothetical protein